MALSAAEIHFSLDFLSEQPYIWITLRFLNRKI